MESVCENVHLSYADRNKIDYMNTNTSIVCMIYGFNLIKN